MVVKTRILFKRRIIGLILLVCGLVALLFAAINSNINAKKNIEIVYADNLVSLNPFSYADFNNSRLNYIYEALVSYSEDLKISPKLAVSFGQISNKHYRFRLKDNIYFHNGTHLDSQLLISILKDIAKLESMQPLLSNISDLTQTGDYTFDIFLENPDYLFLSKLASVPIAITNTDLEANPIGTGPFLLKAQNPNQLYLEPFDDYHQNPAQFNQLLLTTIPNQTQRLEYSLGKPYVLAIFGMSPVYKSTLEKSNLSLESYIEGSTNFLLYNYNRNLSNIKDFRERLSQAISIDMNFSEFSESMAKDTNQLLASGVFGFNPDIKTNQILTQTTNSYNPKILLPEGFNNLAQYLEIALNKHSIFPTFEFDNLYTLDKKEVSNTYDLIFFGFKSDFYDGQSLFSTFLDSNSFNFGNYSNPQAQELMSTLKNLEKPKARQAVLKELGALVLNPENKLAEPLFENKVYYALNTDYKLNPRLDGYLDLTLISF